MPAFSTFFSDSMIWSGRPSRMERSVRFSFFMLRRISVIFMKYCMVGGASSGLFGMARITQWLK